MNATKKCPVCPLEDLSPTALQCPNCKTDLTLLRRIEGLAESFVRDAERLGATDPAAALRSLHTALSLEPTNERFQQRVREAEAAAEQARALPTPAVLAASSTLAGPPSPAAPRFPATPPVSAAPPTSLTAEVPSAGGPRRRSSPLWALGTAAVAVVAFGAGHLIQGMPAASVRPSTPAIVATAATPAIATATQALSASASESEALALYKADHHHSDSEFAALQARLAAAKTVPPGAGLSPQSLRSLEVALTAIGGAHLVRSAGSAYVVFGRPLFSVGSSELGADDRKWLTAVLSVLVDLHVAVEVEGHCDAEPSRRNWDIALDRARAVAALAHVKTPALMVATRAVPETPIPGTMLSSEVNRGVALRIVAPNR